MSIETESRVLSTLIFIGDPKDIRAQEAMLQLSVELFKHNHTRGLFLFIQKQLRANLIFDSTRLLDSELGEVYDFFLRIAEISCSTNMLESDIKLLLDLRRKALIEKHLDNIVYSFKQESIPDKACSIAVEGCMDISKIGIINFDHVYTAEMCIENLYSDNKKSNKIIPTGIETIDSLNGGGFKENCLITIAGRSGMGKTGFAVHLAHKLASNHPNKHVLFYSLEMAFDDIFEKRMTAIIGKQLDSVKDEIEKFNAVAKAAEIPFTIDTKPMASISYIETTAKITAIRKPISVIVVDYIGLVQNTSELESHTLKQADIALRLAALAAELNCIVIALTQVNRDYSNREDKVPVTSDAADSSGSERSSSYWLGIYRPEQDDETDRPNEFIVKCRKNRFGKTWSAVFGFDNATFREVDQIRTYESKKPMKGFANYKESKNK